MMEITLTCPECESGINILASETATSAVCDICNHSVALKFTAEHSEDILKDCPCCERKDFYSQKDFNRKIGVILFVIAAIASIWTYGISFIVLYVFDFALHRKLGTIAICYKCATIFRRAANVKDIPGFNHEMNDRIIYSDHDFGGEPLSH